MPEFTLYTYTFISRAERIQWVLDELKLDYKLEKLDPFKGETGSDTFTKLSPLKKVPVLIHHQDDRDFVLTESLAIMEYLDEYAGKPLTPSSLEESYQYHRAMYFGVSELEAYLWVANQSTLLKGVYHWPDNAETEAIRQVNRALPEAFNWLDDQAYIAGNQFTLADIFYYQLLKWAERYQCQLPKHVQAYLSKLEKREAIPKGFL